MAYFTIKYDQKAPFLTHFSAIYINGFSIGNICHPTVFQYINSVNSYLKIVLEK